MNKMMFAWIKKIIRIHKQNMLANNTVVTSKDVFNKLKHTNIKAKTCYKQQSELYYIICIAFKDCGYKLH